MHIREADARRFVATVGGNRSGAAMRLAGAEITTVSFVRLVG
jgi:hypothetical protein